MDNNQYITSSPYRRGAVYGVPFGLYLTALFFAISYTFDIPLLGPVSFLLMLGVPFMIYGFLRRSFVEDRGTTIYSSLWMEGIAIFFFGGMLTGCVVSALVVSGSAAAISSLLTSLCATSAALTTWSVAARYSSNDSCGLGATSIGAEERYFFKSCNAASASGIHSIGPAFSGS